jgi:hypothetical protein
MIDYGKPEDWVSSSAITDVYCPMCHGEMHQKGKFHCDKAFVLCSSCYDKYVVTNSPKPITEWSDELNGKHVVALEDHPEGWYNKGEVFTQVTNCNSKSKTMFECQNSKGDGWYLEYRLNGTPQFALTEESWELKGDSPKPLTKWSDDLEGKSVVALVDHGVIYKKGELFTELTGSSSGTNIFVCLDSIGIYRFFNFEIDGSVQFALAEEPQESQQNSLEPIAEWSKELEGKYIVGIPGMSRCGGERLFVLEIFNDGNDSYARCKRLSNGLDYNIRDCERFTLDKDQGEKMAVSDKLCFKCKKPADKILVLEGSTNDKEYVCDEHYNPVDIPIHILDHLVDMVDIDMEAEDTTSPVVDDTIPWFKFLFLGSSPSVTGQFIQEFTCSYAIKFKSGDMVEIPSPTGEGWTGNTVRYDFPHRYLSNTKDFPTLFKVNHDEGRIVFDEYKTRMHYEDARIIYRTDWTRTYMPAVTVEETYNHPLLPEPAPSNFWIEDHEVVYRKEDHSTEYPGADQRPPEPPWSGIWMEGHAPTVDENHSHDRCLGEVEYTVNESENLVCVRLGK